MLKTILILPDGTQIGSGKGGAPAVVSAVLTQQVNDSQELSLGSACANMLEVDLLLPEGTSVDLTAGEEIVVYKESETGTRSLVGYFTVEKPTRPTANTLRITAYDRITWLDKDVSQWLAELNGWPYSLLTFAQMV